LVGGIFISTRPLRHRYCDVVFDVFSLHTDVIARMKSP
jgi:hypothetical protein